MGAQVTVVAVRVGRTWFHRDLTVWKDPETWLRESQVELGSWFERTVSSRSVVVFAFMTGPLG